MAQLRREQTGCPTCLSLRNVAERHVRTLSEIELADQRHGSCRAKPSVETLLLTPNGWCSSILHCAHHDARWEHHLSPEELRSIVQRAIDTALRADLEKQGQPA
ncbi:hypothetical protein OG698_46110 [Streptomyces sp. NBC_01003]|uniref:hypothetical protein n=1 Tax=Streptomyces sp. NBC_01003 TaxID=2903714 RepID=UPI0038695DF2|nr:hypothetical protein OG698_46110 [Streptomyces sp. NBC_01003]